VKITLLTYGSRGDVQPFAALARRLMERGHEARLAAPHRFEGFAAELGIPFVPLAGDPEEISRRLNDAGGNVFRMVGGMQEYVLSIAGDVAQAAFGACRSADLIVHSFLFTTGAHSLARQMGIPDVSAQLFPMFLPTGSFPNVAMSGVPRGWPAWFTHWLADQVFWYGGNSGYGRLRKQVGDLLPGKLYWPFRESAGRVRTPVLGAWSPSLLPPPADWPPGAAEVTGWWFLDAAEAAPPAELVDFLSAGKPPVCVSFGSMIHRQAGRIAREVLGGLSAAGERAVVLTGWQDWEAPPGGEVLLLPAAPHDWLFPRCKAIVHHGGAGTTAAGVRSGTPAVVVPFAGDQLFWARRLQAAGVAGEPLPVGRLTAGRLAAAVEAAQREEIVRRARELGQRVQAEDGLGRAAAFIEAQAAKF